MPTSLERAAPQPAAHSGDRLVIVPRLLAVLGEAGDGGVTRKTALTTWRAEGSEKAKLGAACLQSEQTRWGLGLAAKLAL